MTQANWIADAVENLPPLATTEEVGRLLRLSRRHLYRLLSAGKLRSIKTGVSNSSRVLIPRVAVVDFLRAAEA